MENLEIYNKYETPPEWAMKPITGGRMSGKTDISPMWRIKCLTEQFGVVGFGWRYDIVNQWTVQTGDELLAFVHINLYVKLGGVWSLPIVGIGGSMMIVKEKNGLYNDDEAFKKSLTDALSVACKALGIGATVYSGSKYPTEKPVVPKQTATKPEPTKPEPTGTPKDVKPLINKRLNDCKDRKELTDIYKLYKPIIDADTELTATLKTVGAKYPVKK